MLIYGFEVFQISGNVSVFDKISMGWGKINGSNPKKIKNVFVSTYFFLKVIDKMIILACLDLHKAVSSGYFGLKILEVGRNLWFFLNGLSWG